VKGFFVTGTDTGVGKTRVAAALILALRAQGLRVAAMKPVAAGHAPGEPNEDVTALQQAANVMADGRDVNPYAFAESVAPHIAAARAGVRIELSVITEAYARLAAAADAVVVEGAGGWRVPLNADQDMADLARALRLPVVLVVGLRLGCLNHARLSVESIARSRLPLAGWIGNRLDPAMAQQAENLDALTRLLPTPCLGVMAHSPVPGSMPAVWEWLALPND
jgi:dethiobiotin synthetase